MNVMEAIQTRKSIRSYLDRPIEEEKLQAILEAGRLAPSASNGQTWKFVVVRDSALRAQMVYACAGQKFVGEAPAILVVCANDCRNMLCGQPARTIDGSIALSFMLLEAAALGLGACWLGMFHEDKVRTLLHVPEDFQIIAVTPLGYPAKEGGRRQRKPLEDVVIYDGWK